MYKTKYAFKNPYVKDMDYNPKQEIVDLVTKAMMEKNYPPIPESRSNLDRVFDAFSTPLYATAGMVRGAIRDDMSVAEGLAGGIRAGWALGEGYEKGEHTYSKVLEDIGWKPESTAGKIAKGALGFVGDVFLDPVTYLSGGASAIVKGTGKAGLTLRQAEKIKDVAKGLGVAVDTGKSTEDIIDVLAKATHAKTIEKYAGTNINKELVERLATKKSREVAYDLMYAGKEMDKFTAQSIITEQAKKRGVTLTEEELVKDADRLVEKYNKLVGLRNNNTDMTFGLGNTPFGKKIFGKYADKSTTLFTADKLEKLSDNGLGKAYAKLRDSIYGTKLGELFSPNTPLYRASKQDPARVYDFLKFMEYIKGLKGDQLQAEKLIREKAKNMNLTPDETKQVLEMMQDKSIWNKVSATVKFAETKESDEFKKQVREKNVKVLNKIDELLQSKKDIETLKHATDNDLFDAREMQKVFEDEHRQQLIDLDVSKLQKQEHLEGVVKMYEDEIASLQKEIDESAKEVFEKELMPEDITTSFDDYIKSVKDKDAQIDAHKTLNATLNRTDADLVKDINVADVLRKPDSMPDGTYNRAMNSVKKVGYIEYSSKKHIDAFEKAYPTWDKVVVNGKTQFHPPKNVLDHMNGKKPLSAVNPNVVDAIKPIDKKGTIEKLSTYIYGQPDMIGLSTRDEHLEQLVELIKKGADKSMVQDHIEKYKNFYTGKASDMYPWIAKKLGYKSWKETYTDKMNDIAKRARSSKDGKMLPEDAMEFAKLERLNLERMYWLNKFNKMSHEEMIKFFTDEANKEIDEIGESVIARENGMRKGWTADDAKRSAWFNAEVDLRKSDVPVIDDNYNKAFGVEQRSEALNDIFNLLISKGSIQQVNPNHIKWANSVADEIPLLTKNFFGREYSYLTPKQKDLLYNMAIRNANARKDGAKLIGGVDEKTAKLIAKQAEAKFEIARIEGIIKSARQGSTVQVKQGDELVSGVIEKADVNELGVASYIVKKEDGTSINVKAKDIQSVKTDKALLSADDLVKQSDMAMDFIAKQDELTKALEEAKAGLKSLDVEYNTNLYKMLDEFNIKSDDIQKRIADLEETDKMIQDAFKSVDESKLNDLTKKSYQLEEALSSDDALETFARMTLGDGNVEDIIKRNNPKVAKTVLDANTEVSAKVKELVKALRGDFMEIAEQEVKIGKLKQEQVDAWLMDYLPHIITEEGRRLFAKDEVTKIIPQFGDDLGYGRKFNPFSLSRQIKYLPDGNGGWIEKPTIEQINEFFKQFTQGKNVFSENIADIYLARAMKHTELMYDHKYMNEMMDVFGKPLKGVDVEKGYKAVSNYGQIKEYVRTTSSKMAKVTMKLMKQQGQQITETTFRELFEKNVGATLERMGLDPRILDDVSMPMIELNKEQISKIQRIDGNLIRQVSDPIVLKANQARKLQIAKDKSRFLQMYDKFTHFIKLNQTTVLPAFHMRNKMSNTFLNWLGVGADAVNMEFQKKAYIAMKNDGNVEGALKITKPDGSVDAIMWKDLFATAKKYGVVDDGFFAKDLGAESMSTGKLSFLKPKHDPTDTKNFVLYKKGAEFGGTIEGADRFIHFASMVSRGASFEEATESVNKFLFDYSDLTAFEKTYMKRLIPYYTWLRKNAELQLQMMLEQPKKFLYVSKVMGGIEGMVNEEDRINKAFVNDFAKDWVQTPFSVTNPEGRKEPVLWNPNLPFMDIGRIPDPMHPIQSAKNLFTQLNPIMKVPIEQATNTNVFFEQPIVEEGDDAFTQRARHVLSQSGLYNAGSEAVEKNGADFGLHMLNTLGGVKMLSYDYEKYKMMKIKELLDKKRGELNK